MGGRAGRTSLHVRLQSTGEYTANRNVIKKAIRVNVSQFEVASVSQCS